MGRDGESGRQATSVQGMARWERLYHEWVALDFAGRLYWPRLVSTGSTHRNSGRPDRKPATSRGDVRS
jgi:hypothetical protein